MLPQMLNNIHLCKKPLVYFLLFWALYRLSQLSVQHLLLAVQRLLLSVQRLLLAVQRLLLAVQRLLLAVQPHLFTVYCLVSSLSHPLPSSLCSLFLLSCIRCPASSVHSPSPPARCPASFIHYSASPAHYSAFSVLCPGSSPILYTCSVFCSDSPAQLFSVSSIFARCAWRLSCMPNAQPLLPILNHMPFSSLFFSQFRLSCSANSYSMSSASFVRLLASPAQSPCSLSRLLSSFLCPLSSLSYACTLFFYITCLFSALIHWNICFLLIKFRLPILCVLTVLHKVGTAYLYRQNW
jgi:hypothetical protein